MARASYSLRKYATSAIKSSNGTNYTLSFWDQLSGGSETWTLGASGLQINYETAEVQNKNSSILTSKATIPLMIENLSQENYVKAWQTDNEEKDVWITIENGPNMFWAGYVLMDLDNKEDVSYPYEMTLTAVDGLAALKDVPFLRETNSDTGATPTFPYLRSDTWDNGGFRRIIGNSTSWIKLLLDFAGQLLVSDDESATGDIDNYTIQTAFNWWNEDMGVSPSVAEDPLANMALSMMPFYTKDGDGYYTVPNVFDVLDMICKNFNMRLIYWEHCFHFVQISEYNTDEQSSSPYATPVNIPTREYYYTGSSRSDNNYLGSNNMSLYHMVFENATAVSTGLQKLAGATYQGLPALKTVEGTYSEMAGSNRYSGFPLFLTHNDGTVQTPTTWPTDGSSHSYKQLPLDGTGSNVQTASMLFTDAKDLAGFVCKIVLDFTNTTNASLEMDFLWTIRAKPVSSAWGDGDNKVLYRHQYSNYASAQWQSYEFPLANNQQYIYDRIIVPSTSPGSTPVTIVCFDSATSQTTNNTQYGGDNAGYIPTDSDFEGDWEFQFYTFTEYDNNAVNPMEAYNQGNGPFSHGRVTQIIPAVAQNYNAATTLVARTPTDYALDYVNTPNGNLTPPLEGLFLGVTTGQVGFGNAGITQQITQSGTNNFIYDIGNVKWGDGAGALTKTTLKVLDGSGGWVFVNASGKWAKGVYTWGGSSYSYATPTYNKTLLDMLTDTILYNQSSVINTMQATSALSETDKYYSGSTRLKFLNPLAKLKDVDNTEYMFMRGTFTLYMDEWANEYVQVFYDVPTTVTKGTRDSRNYGG
tara:strand:- start:200 stop:2629 length:2430 start_codon:yes stop_codon:yes gene_type:complete